MRTTGLLLLVLALPLAGCNGSGLSDERFGQTASSSLTSLGVDGARITDEKGRELLLRGLNHIALRSDRNHPPYRDEDSSITPDVELFELQDLETADFDAIAATGLNALRLVVTWEFAQPDPPPAPYNEAYFRRIDAFVAQARSHGLYVFLSSSSAGH